MKRFILTSILAFVFASNGLAQEAPAPAAVAAPAAVESPPLRIVLQQGDTRLLEIPVPRDTYSNLVSLYRLRTRVQGMSGTMEAVLQAELSNIATQLRSQAQGLVADYERQTGMLGMEDLGQRLDSVIAAETERRALIAAKAKADQEAREAERARQLAALEQQVLDAQARAAAERQALMEVQR